MAILTISQLSSTTPTLAETMRACFLRAGLSRSQGSREYVLSNPKAWLGIAYHGVLEALPGLATNETSVSLSEDVDARWNHSISRLAQQATAHPLNRRFGPPQTWKGYFLVLETLRLRVRDFAPIVTSRSQEEEPRLRERKRRTSREEEFEAFGGQLRGRIDLLRGDEIIDYKTGALFENETGDSEPSLKEAYVRQLRLYAYLAHSATGTWPKRGLLYPLAGSPVVVELDPSDCEREAEEAVNLLKLYNQSIASAETTNDAASPSPEACRWCPFKIICSPFWTTASVNWPTILDGDAVSGRLLKAPLSIHGGTAWSISLTVDMGTIPNGEVAIAPLSSDVHSSISELSAGERVRIVGLGQRANGSLFPTLRTVVLSEDHAPTIQSALSDGARQRSL